jgi:hypothetical protein
MPNHQAYAAARVISILLTGNTWRTNVQRNEYPYDLHWTRHAARYLALVHAALEKNPDDLELQELLHAMEATVALSKRPLH